jgi:hypothetical protein
MVVYEITAVVEKAVAADYERYLTKQHISDLMATGCFVSAMLSRTDNTFQIRYTAPDQKDLDRYLSEHAGKLRADALEHFPDGVQLTRQVWDVVAEFAAQ